MGIVRKIGLVVIILGLLSMMSPTIKESAANLLGSATGDANHAISTVAESGGFSNTWNSLTKLGGDIFNEVTNANADK